MASCLSHRFVFGIQGSRSNAIAFCDQATIVYVAGHNIVIYNILEGQQRFIHGSDTSDLITAMSLCPSARFVALAEDGEKSTVRKKRACRSILPNGWNHTHLTQQLNNTHEYSEKQQVRSYRSHPHTVPSTLGVGIRSSHSTGTQGIAHRGRRKSMHQLGIQP